MEPVVLRQDLVKERCSQKPWSTVGHGLLHYGLMAKTIPDAKGATTKEFLVTLNRKFNEKCTWGDGGVIVPGLTMVPYEGVGTKYGITGNARAGFCKPQRIDGKTRCVIDHPHGYTRYYYQGFKTIIALSNDHSLSLLDGYLNSVENTVGYRESNISVSRIKM